jgi:hypothetical protein
MEVSIMDDNKLVLGPEDLEKKCATLGCHGTKYEGEFCLACVAQNPWKPLVQRSCDNMACVADDVPQVS